MMKDVFLLFQSFMLFKKMFVNVIFICFPPIENVKNVLCHRFFFLCLTMCNPFGRILWSPATPLFQRK